MVDMCGLNIENEQYKRTYTIKWAWKMEADFI